MNAACETKELRDRVEYLEAEVARLKAIIYPSILLIEVLDLTHRQAVIVQAVLRRPGISLNALVEVVYALQDDYPDYPGNVVRVEVVRTRKKLKTFGIEMTSRSSHGYRFEAAALARLRELGAI